MNRRPPRPAFRWWILALSTLTQMVAALSSQGIGAWGSSAQAAFGLSTGQIGTLATLLNVAPIVGLTLAGRVLDRHGERSPVFIGLLALGGAFFFLARAQGYALLIVVMLLMGMGYSPIQPGGSKAVYHWFPARERGLAMGIRQAALPLGGACAAAFFPAVIAHAGWEHTMDIAAAITAGCGLFYLLTFRNPPLHGRTVAAAAAISPRALLWSVWQTLAGNFRQPALRRISLVGATLVGAQTAVSVFWVLFMRHRFGVSLSAAAGLLFIVQISGSLGRVALSAFSDHLADGRRRVVLACLALVPAGLLPCVFLPPSSPGWLLAASSGAVGFFAFGWYGPWVVWLSDAAPDERVGEVIGAAMGANQIAIALVPVLFGWLADATGTTTLPWLGLCAVVGAMSGWNWVRPVSGWASGQ